jgi:hypothetical protein
VVADIGGQTIDQPQAEPTTRNAICHPAPLTCGNTQNQPRRSAAPNRAPRAPRVETRAPASPAVQPVNNTMSAEYGAAPKSSWHLLRKTERLTMKGEPSASDSAQPGAEGRAATDERSRVGWR